MPAMTYPIGTPEDRRWDWYMPVPEPWRSLPPPRVIANAQYVFASHGITKNGLPAEVAVQRVEGDWHLLVKSDVDPATKIDPANLPAVPKTPQETRRERLAQFSTVLRAGTPLTNPQVQEAILHLIESHLEATR